MEEIVLNAIQRKIETKSALKQLRASKKIPGIVYGDNKENAAVSFFKKDFLNVIHGEAGLNVIISLQINESSDKVLVHELQRDVLTREIIHVDFHRIKLSEKIKVNVPVHLIGESIGHKEGGVVDQVAREIEVECMPLDIPPNFEVNIEKLNIGDAVLVKEITAPDKVVILTDPESIVVHVVFADKEEPKLEPLAEEAAAEPEVIAKGKEKEEGAEGAAEKTPAPKEQAKPEKEKK